MKFTSTFALGMALALGGASMAVAQIGRAHV